MRPERDWSHAMGSKRGNNASGEGLESRSGRKNGPKRPRRGTGREKNKSIMSKDRFDIKERENMGLLTDACVIIDKETGVNYLYVGRGYGGGLTPLLNAEGKPIITKDGYKK